MGYTTEEEQVEALRKWWRESGTSILAGVVLAMAAIFGWQAWEKHRLEQRVEASAAFQQLGEAWEQTVQPGGGSEAATRTFLHLAQRLQEEHAGTVYAHLGSLQLARYLVDREDLEGAERNLRWVLERDAPSAIAEVARLRLAQVQFAQGDADGALATLDGDVPEALAADWAELRGDILLHLERAEEAVAAYRKAGELASAAGQRRPLLELKLDDLAVSPEES